MGQKTKKKQQKNHPSQPASPWPKRLGWAAAVGLVVGLAAVVFLSAPGLRGVPEGTASVDVAAPAHVEGDIHDDGDVPAGGPHSEIWQNCKFYDTEIRSENAVHSLEHGAVWITYRPDVPTDDVNRLRSFTGNNEKVLVSPVPGQGSPIIATAWANQLELDSAQDPRLDQFVNEFKRGTGAPEPGGRCTGGIG